mmetsp:Transcript_26734/g.32531  ORF Transcript_26734/g.32531 Transcript_26734/m.32531 type:complete len:380 (-) Transcript_26734:39-1178(-)
MASTKKALLAKAATSKAAAYGTRATSKAAAMAGLPKAGVVGATARRFIQKAFSKAAATARPDVTMFAGKAFAVPPWRGGKVVPPKAKSMDDDYDPFSEQPAPHVEMEKVFRTAARKAAGDGNAVDWRPQEDPLLGVVKLPPWRRKPAPKANLAPSQPKRKAAPRPRNAQAWLRRPRHNQGGLAEEYFQKEEKPPEKKQKVEVKRGFVKELLDKAPSTLQTCRSLLLFLDKKAEAVLEKPPVRSPEALQARLEAHAESLGRLEGLRTPGGWDARAKRVLDINATATSPPGEAALSALEKVLEKETKELQKQVKEAGEKLEDVLKERQAWAKETVRRDWIGWCAKLLRVRERQLLGEKEDGEQMLMTAVDVLEALVAGTTT